MEDLQEDLARISTESELAEWIKDFNDAEEVVVKLEASHQRPETSTPDFFKGLSSTLRTLHDPKRLTEFANHKNANPALPAEVQPVYRLAR